MRKITAYHITGYALGFAFCLIGLTMLIAILWKALPNVSTSDGVFPALEQYLWTKDFDFGFGVRLKLMYLTVMGATALAFGVLVLAFSRKTFYVGRNVLLQCPFCKKQWKASRARGWGTCPYCNHKVQSKVAKIRK